MDSQPYLQDLLLRWFRENGRQLPWRRRVDPYEVIVAEFLLQRTTAKQVQGVYEDFLKAYPTVQDLSVGNLRSVKRYFAHLGLIQRAQRLKQIARDAVRRFGGSIPPDRSVLLTLPGVGDYIADAVLAFAYGLDVAVIDGNVSRVFGRIFGIQTRNCPNRDLDLGRRVRSELPKGKGKEFNWAVLDLAALICKPRKPRCLKCPLEKLCVYRTNEWARMKD